jgi:hypothetical protein
MGGKEMTEKNDLKKVIRKILEKFSYFTRKTDQQFRENKLRKCSYDDLYLQQQRDKSMLRMAMDRQPAPRIRRGMTIQRI